MIYCQFLVDQALITRSRRTFDRSLRALPITQVNNLMINIPRPTRHFYICLY